jgi:predicted Zn-dependent protease
MADSLPTPGLPAPNTATGDGPDHRAQRLALGPNTELALGRKAYHQVLSHGDLLGSPLPSDSALTLRVRQVVDGIARAASIEALQRAINLRPGYRFEWEVTILDNTEVNAFCFPGGKIAVFTGLLRFVENDDQLAAVLAHEMAHALAHHVNEQMAEEQVHHGQREAAWLNAFEREQEREADHIGLLLMTFAGYNPEHAVHFWERLHRVRCGALLGDHPSDESRIVDLKARIGDALRAKQAYDAMQHAPPPDP